jgi:hypothetical protein
MLHKIEKYPFLIHIIVANVLLAASQISLGPLLLVNHSVYIVNGEK